MRGDAGGSTMGGGALACVVLLAVSGCVAGMAPPEDPALRYEGPIRSRDVGEGGRVYIALCAACHRGRVNPRGYRWSPAQMRHQIREGNRVMPALPRQLISDEQVEAVLAYLAETGALDGELPPEEPAPVEPEPDQAVASRIAPVGEPAPSAEADASVETAASDEPAATVEADATVGADEGDTSVEGDASVEGDDDGGHGDGSGAVDPGDDAASSRGPTGEAAEILDDPR